MQTETILLQEGEVLCQAGDVIKYILLPLNCIISLWTPIKASMFVEVGLIGNEGSLGLTTLLDVALAPVEARVQYAGLAISIPVTAFLETVNLNPELSLRFNHYLYVRHTQLLRTATCNCFHLLEQRLARLLLMIGARLHSDDFYIRHSQLSEMLGVRRSGVTKAAGELDSKKLIQYTRGNLSIINSLGLESAACTCYKLDNQIYSSQMN